MAENEDGRIGLEVYYTGRQRLEANPYRDISEPYTVVGVLMERRFGPVRLFLNLENLTDVQQHRWHSALRPDRAPRRTLDRRRLGAPGWTRDQRRPAGAVLGPSTASTPRSPPRQSASTR